MEATGYSKLGSIWGAVHTCCTVHVQESPQGPWLLTLDDLQACAGEVKAKVALREGGKTFSWANCSLGSCQPSQVCGSCPSFLTAVSSGT